MQLDFFGDETDHFLLSFFPLFDPTSKKETPYWLAKKKDNERNSISHFRISKTSPPSRNSLSSLSLFFTLNSVKEGVQLAALLFQEIDKAILWIAGGFLHEVRVLIKEFKKLLITGVSQLPDLQISL